MYIYIYICIYIYIYIYCVVLTSVYSFTIGKFALTSVSASVYYLSSFV